MKSVCLLALTSIALSQPAVAQDPIEDAINACFTKAYEVKSILVPYKDNECGVTCGKGNGFNAKNEHKKCTYVAPANHRVETYVFESTSRTDRGYVVAPRLIQNGQSAIAFVGCRGHKSVGSAREWSKGYIRGNLRYLPTDAEQRQMIDTCIDQTLGGGE